MPSGAAWARVRPRFPSTGGATDLQGHGPQVLAAVQRHDRADLVLEMSSLLARVLQKGVLKLSYGRPGNTVPRADGLFAPVVRRLALADAETLAAVAALLDERHPVEENTRP
jgi:hypothetical protein